MQKTGSIIDSKNIIIISFIPACTRDILKINIFLGVSGLFLKIEFADAENAQLLVLRMSIRLVVVFWQKITIFAVDAGHYQLKCVSQYGLQAYCLREYV